MWRNLGIHLRIPEDSFSCLLLLCWVVGCTSELGVFEFERIVDLVFPVEENGPS